MKESKYSELAESIVKNNYATTGNVNDLVFKKNKFNSRSSRLSKIKELDSDLSSSKNKRTKSSWSRYKDELTRFHHIGNLTDWGVFDDEQLDEIIHYGDYLFVNFT